ncbi:MAG: polysaccharide biosynthesis/export family protein [Bryobacteraceae bacterium]
MRLIFVAVLAAAMAAGQAGNQTAGRPQPPQPEPQQAEAPRPVYLLSPGDQIVIRAQNVEEISEKPFRIDGEGFLNLPVVGRIRAAGMTVEQLEAALVDRLKLFVRSPQVVVSVIETARPQEVANPVYLVGAFKQPGVYPLGTRPETLGEVLMRTGGLLPTAMRRVKVIRRIEQGRLDLKNVTESTDGKTTYGEVALTVTGELADPADNIVMKPQDVVVAMKLEPVYVTGEVARSGAFPLEDRDYLSATQILAMAGAGPNADLEKARVLRVVGDSSQRAEITINLKDIFSGKANDFPLMANDVLYIPRKSGTGQAVARLGLIAVPALITSLIWVWVRQ